MSEITIIKKKNKKLDDIIFSSDFATQEEYKEQIKIKMLEGWKIDFQGDSRELLRKNWFIKSYEKPDNIEFSKIAIYSGMGCIAFPTEWLIGFNPYKDFARKGKKSFMRFNSIGKTCGIFNVWGETNIYELSEKEEEGIEWGTLCYPFEPYELTQIFGHTNKILYVY